jgi:glucose-6-phosphate isomerase
MKFPEDCLRKCSRGLVSRTHVVLRRQWDGEKDMVILPCNNRLGLFTKYFRQLMMESLGKEKNLAGKIVHPEITVCGNEGSTDQHSRVQQLRDAVLNLFVIFVEVRNDLRVAQFEVENKPASKLLQLQREVQEQLSSEEKAAEGIARSIEADPEGVFHQLRHLASSIPQIKVIAGEEAMDDRFFIGESP